MPHESFFTTRENLETSETLLPTPELDHLEGLRKENPFAAAVFSERYAPLLNAQRDHRARIEAAQKKAEQKK